MPVMRIVLRCHSRGLHGNPVLIGNTRTGFPPAGENDGGEGGENDDGEGGREGRRGGRCIFLPVMRIVLRCHSRGLHGNPVLIGNTRTGFPPAGENDGGEGGENDSGEGWREGRRGGMCIFLPVMCLVLRRHSRGLHGNPVLDRILDSRLLALAQHTSPFLYRRNP